MGSGPLGWRRILDVSALVAMIAAAGVVTFVALEQRSQRTEKERSVGNTPPVPAEPVSLAGAVTKGSEDARILVMVFSDFQCPFCSRFATETLPEIERRFVATGKVRLAFRHLPLSRIHPFAARAAEGASCAARQGRFWEMHDELFKTVPQAGDGDLIGFGRTVGLDIDAFKKCLESGDGRVEVTGDLALAKSLRVTGTPAFLIGARLPNGFLKAVT